MTLRYKQDMKSTKKHFAVCLNNKGYPASLEIRKLYQAIPDETAAKVRQIRVVDESGEDYLYPDNYFAAVRLPEAAERALLRLR
jgi:hypothetical protein